MASFDDFKNEWLTRRIDYDLGLSAPFIESIIGTVTWLAHSFAFVFPFSRATFNACGELTSPFSSRFSMQAGMFCSAYKHKVFNTIVSFIMIFMMYNLIRKKITAKVLLHYKSMFSYSVIVRLWMLRSIYKYIAVNIFSYSSFPVRAVLTAHKFTSTNSRTKLFGMGLIISKCFIALYASVMTFSGNIITMATAKTSFLTRWSSEYFNTVFTGVSHSSIIAVPMHGGNNA